MFNLPNDNIFTITQVERYVMVTSTSATFNGQQLNVFIKGNNYKMNNGNYSEGWYTINIDKIFQ